MLGQRDSTALRRGGDGIRKDTNTFPLAPRRVRANLMLGNTGHQDMERGRARVVPGLSESHPIEASSQNHRRMLLSVMCRRCPSYFCIIMLFCLSCVQIMYLSNLMLVPWDPAETKLFRTKIHPTYIPFSLARVRVNQCSSIARVK